MSHNTAIFIFTKDRPHILAKTLNSISCVSHQKYVIDDSLLSANQDSVLKICKTFKETIYIGKQYFNEFIIEKNINLLRFSFLLREPGNADWNLGYIRNLALIVSKSLGLESVLFMDDDIEVENIELIDTLFSSLKHYRFSGANIKGLIDDSILGHTATDLGIENERMLSGGFMAFNPNKIEHFFLNNYNEDWIWLFLQLKDKAYLQFGEVYQELSNPLKNYKDRIKFQEFGEIALDGILDLYEKGNYKSLQQISFWKRMVQERLEYLEMLIEKGMGHHKEDYVEIISWVKYNSRNFTAELFCNLYQEYFRNQVVFLNLYNSLSKTAVVSGDYHKVQ